MSMRLDKLIIALLIFSVILLTGVSMIADINSNYEINMSTSEFKDSYDLINENYNLSKDLTEKAEASEIDDADALDSTIKNAVSAARLVGSTKQLFYSIIKDIADTLKVPALFVQIAMIAITIFIAFALIYLFMRFKP